MPNETICPSCGETVQLATGSLGPVQLDRGNELRLVPECLKDGEILMLTRPTYTEHRCEREAA